MGGGGYALSRAAIVLESSPAREFHETISHVGAQRHAFTYSYCGDNNTSAGTANT